MELVARGAKALAVATTLTLALTLTLTGCRPADEPRSLSLVMLDCQANVEVLASSLISGNSALDICEYELDQLGEVAFRHEYEVSDD